MSTLLSLAYQHHGFHGGLSGWIAHTLISAIIHGMIYEMIWKTMRELTLGQSVVLVAVALGGLYLWLKSLDRRWR